MNSNLFRWNEMCRVPDWFVVEGFSLGAADYLDDLRVSPSEEKKEKKKGLVVALGRTQLP